MMWGGYGWPAGWMLPLMGVSAVLWWVLVVAVVLAMVRWMRSLQDGGRGGAPTGTPDHDDHDARAVLDLRFARGEIDADEYTDRRRLLTGS
jgi:putative membrane protein